jgi:hypothetical protein
MNTKPALPAPAVSESPDANMPPLPEPFGHIEQGGMWDGRLRLGVDPVYDCDQMYAYARNYARKLQKRLSAAERRPAHPTRDELRMVARDVYFGSPPLDDEPVCDTIADAIYSRITGETK